MKCVAILGDYFMKSEEIVLRDFVIESNEEEKEGKILGLFDDDSYREQRNIIGILSSAAKHYSFHGTFFTFANVLLFISYGI